MAICCLVAAAAHVCLYFTPPVNRNGASSVTHDLAARLLCRDGRMAVCVTQDPGNNDVWNGSKVEGNATGGRQKVRGQRGLRAEVRGSCSIQCCSVVDPTLGYGYQTLTSEQAMRGPASFRKEGQSTETTAWRTSEDDPASSSTASSTRESSELPGVKVMSDSAIANLWRNCENFTNLTLGESNWTSAFDAEVKDCASVWIVDLLENLTGDARTCDSAEWTYSLCTLQCQGFDPYSNASDKDGYGSGEEDTIRDYVCRLLCLLLHCVSSSVSPLFHRRQSRLRNPWQKGQKLWASEALGNLLIRDIRSSVRPRNGRPCESWSQERLPVSFYSLHFPTLGLSRVVVPHSRCKKPNSPITAVLTLSSADAPLQVSHMPGLPSSPDLSNGKSSSLVTLGSQLGQWE